MDLPFRGEPISYPVANQFARRHETACIMRVPVVSVLIIAFAYITDTEAHNIRFVTRFIQGLNPRLRPRDIDVVSYLYSIHTAC